MKSTVSLIKQDSASIIKLVCAGLNRNTALSYGREIQRFLDWLAVEQKTVSLASAGEYKQSLVEANKSTSSVNLALASIRFFVRQAAKHNFITEDLAKQIAAIPSIKGRGQKLGNWLTKAELEALLSQPHKSPFAGSLLAYRDQAILSVLGGAGLRRSEVAALRFEQIVSRDNRWILADIVGKRNVTRSVPIANWIKNMLDGWLLIAQISSGFVFRSVSWKAGQLSQALQETQVADETISNAVSRYSVLAIGKQISAHDLRRSFARLASENGCPLEQIQLSLGHSSLLTTQIYLGSRQNLQNAPSDFLHLEIETPGQ